MKVSVLKKVLALPQVSDDMEVVTYVNPKDPLDLEYEALKRAVPGSAYADDRYPGVFVDQRAAGGSDGRFVRVLILSK